MFIIAGLGNPGRKYENTRHNVGFMVIDELAGIHHISVAEKKHKALIGKGIIGGEKVILVKPQTFMNLSGESIREIIDYYKIEEKTQLIVISDDVSMDPGAVRIRKRGSAGGHNGLKNIILHLGHDEFQRIKLGVGEKPAGGDLVDHVLGSFSKEESELIAESVKSAAGAVEVMITDGADTAMNRFNKKGRESM
ncbi:MAG: aminoacyl-tRNA hydrolase [Roseburia sp.]|nr:aminoacyl-tRNA hydrolase [Roseburia sp.]MCM1242025.1 aminoacyl-tRNA hydrolase [Roseburia sp.]